MREGRCPSNKPRQNRRGLSDPVPLDKLEQLSGKILVLQQRRIHQLARKVYNGFVVYLAMGSSALFYGSATIDRAPVVWLCFS
jgi:hypothetical protein